MPRARPSSIRPSRISCRRARAACSRCPIPKGTHPPPDRCRSSGRTAPLPAALPGLAGMERVLMVDDLIDQFVSLFEGVQDVGVVGPVAPALHADVDVIAEHRADLLRDEPGEGAVIRRVAIGIDLGIIEFVADLKHFELGGVAIDPVPQVREEGGIPPHFATRHLQPAARPCTGWRAGRAMRSCRRHAGRAMNWLRGMTSSPCAPGLITSSGLRMSKNCSVIVPPGYRACRGSAPRPFHHRCLHRRSCHDRTGSCRRKCGNHFVAAVCIDAGLHGDCFARIKHPFAPDRASSCPLSHPRIAGPHRRGYACAIPFHPAVKMSGGSYRSIEERTVAFQI